MKDFELQYAKYEERFKKIEFELKDYNMKSKLIEEEDFMSPLDKRMINSEKSLVHLKIK